MEDTPQLIDGKEPLASQKLNTSLREAMLTPPNAFLSKAINEKSPYAQSEEKTTPDLRFLYSRTDVDILS